MIPAKRYLVFLSIYQGIHLLAPFFRLKTPDPIPETLIAPQIPSDPFCADHLNPQYEGHHWIIGNPDRSRLDP
jgi:hypothetical protein